MSRKLTTENIVEKAKLIHGDKYDLSKINYVNSNTKIKIVCYKHGEFEIFPYDFIKGHGCAKCGFENNTIRNTSTNEEFIKKANIVHQNKYDYSKVNYINSKFKIIIICKDHGQFLERANRHLTGDGCPTCGGKYRISQEEFIEQAKLIHNNKYDYSKVNFVNKKTKVDIICLDHGIFKQTPENHLKGCKCHVCNKEIRRKKDDIFYITKKCENCGIEFVSKKKENLKYCSYKCTGEGRTKNSKEKRICKICGKEFEERIKYPRKFCSKDCRNKWESLPESIEYKTKKTKEAVLKKYGVDSVMKLKEVREKINKSITPEIIELQKEGLKKAVLIQKEKRNNKIQKRFWILLFTKGFQNFHFNNGWNII